MYALKKIKLRNRLLRSLMTILLLSALFCVSALAADELQAPTMSGSHVAESGKNWLIWNYASGATGYRVYRSSSASGKYTQVKDIDDSEVNYYVDDNAAAGTGYYYYVEAYNDDGDTEASEVKYLVADLPRPDISATSPDETVTLSWTSVEDADGYDIYRSDSLEGTYKKITSVSGSVTTWTDSSSDISMGSTYYYKVVAYMSDNREADSAFNLSARRTVEYDIQDTAFLGLTTSEFIAKVGPLIRADMQKSGILASVTAAQMIVESGWGKSELAQNANNCFGMKYRISGNTWSGSLWDGSSYYTIQTGEEDEDGNKYTITADFRKYPCVGDSIADHSAYLANAMNGDVHRYEGVVGCTDYKTALQIIKDGGYATSSNYVSYLCSIIEKYNLTDLDK